MGLRRWAALRISDFGRRHGPEPAGIAPTVGLPGADLAMALEPRFMFDAAGVATAAEQAGSQADAEAASSAHADSAADAGQAEARQSQAVELDHALDSATQPAGTGSRRPRRPPPTAPPARLRL